jgi:hypothetical protein
MNNRQHIQKKHPSQSTYTPVQNLYQTRAFDIQQQPSHSSSGQENVDLDADHEQSQYNRYNLPYIPVNAPGTEPPPPIQTKLNSGDLLIIISKDQRMFHGIIDLLTRISP